MTDFDSRINFAEAASAPVRIISLLIYTIL